MKKEFSSSILATKKDLFNIKKKVNALKLKKNKLPVLIGSGEHFSPFKTRGLDFQEVRVYQPGDDIRLIDWRITAKHNKPYTKLFTDEKERQVFVLTDMQKTMKFATQGSFKSVVAAKTSAFLSFLATNKQDKLGFCILFDNKIECAFSGGNDETLLSFFEALEEAGVPSKTTNQETTLEQALLKSEKFIKKGAMFFILSDFNKINEKEKEILSRISKKATCSLVHIYDQIEKNFPKSTLPISDGDQILFLNGKQKSTQKKYHKIFQERTDLLLDMTKNPNIGYLPLATDEDYLLKIASFCQGGLL